MAHIPEKFMNAQSVEEVAELLKVDGMDVAGAKRAWEEVCYEREHQDEELSLDELDAVAGGSSRDWLEEGCAATVEPDSYCWGTDAGCVFINVNYAIMPDWHSCDFCGAKYTMKFDFNTFGRNHTPEYKCRECGADYYWDSRGNLVRLH